MSAVALDADVTFVERHATVIAGLLIVLLVVAALTSAQHSLFTVVADALSAGATR